MFRIRLVLVRTETRWLFRVSHGFRVLNLLTAVGLLAAGWALDTYLVPLILAGLAVVGAFYEESAAFDRGAGRAEFRWGLLFLHRTRFAPLSDVAEVRVSTFGQASFTGLEVGLADGTVRTIENDRGKASTERLKAWGEELAQWLDRPFVQSL